MTGWVMIDLNETIFPRGRVIPSEDVLSRNGFVRELEERLFLGDSTMLAGPRRIGKTSVAVEVLNRLRERGCYTVEIDLFHVPSIEEFGLQLMQKVLQVRTGLIRSAAHTIKGFLENLSKSEFQVKIQDLEITTHLNSMKESPEAVLDEALGIAERIGKKDGKRIIIMFDEWQEADRIGGETLLKRLRSIFQHQNHVSYLFLGSEPSMMRTLFADRRQAFYRFATMLHLPDITREEWNEYVHSKFEQSGISIDQNAFDELMDSSGGHPYCVMTILMDVVLQLRLRHANHIDSTIMGLSIDRSFDQLEAIYDELWKRVHEIKGAEKVLIALAEGTPPYRTNDDVVVKRALNRLLNISILKRIKRGEYQFVEPMFEKWIVRQR